MRIECFIVQNMNLLCNFKLHTKNLRCINVYSLICSHVQIIHYNVSIIDNVACEVCGSNLAIDSYMFIDCMRRTNILKDNASISYCENH